MTGFRRVGIGTADIRAEDVVRVNQALASGRLSAGPMTAEFEAAFASAHGVRHASMCNSGTGALQLSLQALKDRYSWPSGAEVIVPAMTFVATVNVVLFNDLVPVLVDIDPLTFTMDPRRLGEAITEKTVAVMPVHLFGQPADMTSIMEICERRGLRVIEDSAEAAFVRHRGRFVGSFGDFGCFSTYMAHIVTTGVGGLAVTDDPDNALRFASLMNHGRNPAYLRIDDDEDVGDEELLRIVWSRYDFVSIGQSYRVTECEAALGIGQIARIEEVLTARRRAAAALTAGLAAEELQLPITAEGNEHAFMMYPIVAQRPGLRDRLIVALERAGVETRLLLPILGQPCYRGVLQYQSGRFPIAEHSVANGFYIGCHQNLTALDIDHVVDIVRSVLRSRSTDTLQ